MKVSLNTIRQYIYGELPEIDELVQRISQQLGGVEEVIDLGDRYKDALVVRVVSCEKHPNADKLSVCRIDDGQKTDIDRDENGLIQVVCGAPNVHSDMWAVWLPPSSTVPSTYHDKDPFVLGSRDLRGVLSNGMLAAGDELAINNDHEGIVELSDSDLSVGGVITELSPGIRFAKAFGLDDTIIDIENKMFTHRPDCFGQLGVAREVAGILGYKFTSPDWYREIAQFSNASGLELTVENQAKKSVPRLMAVAMSGVTISSSPLWLQTTLLRWGSKSISNVVDITNYIMLLTAQPTHAYDYDKLRGHRIISRLARSGETISLLNGRQYELAPTDIVIADGEGAIGLAGIMGGANSEVSADTKNIVLEVATFDMYAVRKSSMRHGIFTDALTRFNKGQSPLQNEYVMKLLMELMASLAGAQQTSSVADIKMFSDAHDEFFQGKYDPEKVSVSAEFINQRLGLSLSSAEITALLANVEINSDKAENDAYIRLQVPFWRTDIELSEDIVEEVGRLYGYDKLPYELPLRSIKPVAKNPRREMKSKIRSVLADLGANEVLTYSFVHEKTLKRAEQDIEQAFKLSNALSPDLQYYRLSVLPSLLDKVHSNIKAGHDEFILYEIGKGHNKKYHANDDDGLPRELEFVDAVYTSKKPAEGAPYYHMRQLVSRMARKLGLKVVFKPIDEPLDYPVTAPFDQSRSALVETTDGKFIGMIGELKQSVIKGFKLPAYTSAMTLDFEGILTAFSTVGQSYSPLSKYPSVSQDISLRVATQVAHADIYGTAGRILETLPGNMQYELSTLSVYQPKDDGSLKTITLRLTIADHDKTLSDKDVSAILDSIAQTAHSTYQAERI